jgi:tripartite-type tricarboxylate transporter receptor subunit TctC
MMRALTLISTLAACMALQVQSAETAFPTRPVRLIVPFAPGGGVDIMARQVGARLSERWGQTVVVDNRPGATGQIGAEIVTRAIPDGYTLVLISVSHVTGPLVTRRSLYDPINSFEPVIQTSLQSFIMGVSASLPLKSVKEFIEYAKNRKPSLNFTSSDTGSASHLSGELFKMMAGIDMQHVPYKGSAPALTDTAAGHVPVIFVTSLPALPFIKQGRIRALAATAARRIPSLPDVPTVAESGLPGFDTGSWDGLMAPPGTPRSLVMTINQAVAAVLKTPEVRDRFLNDGTLPIAGTPEEFKAMMLAEQKRWTPVVKQMKLE